MAKLVKTMNKSRGVDILVELFNEQSVWDTQTAIKNELMERGIEVHQATLSRWLKEIGVLRDPKNDFKWTRAKRSSYEKNLAKLKKLVDETRDKPARIWGSVDIAVMKTKEGYNWLMAKKIRETFTDEILSVFCPSDGEIIIYYRKGESGEKLKDKMLSVLRKVCREAKTQRRPDEKNNDTKEKSRIPGASALSDNCGGKDQSMEEGVE
jgi:arginine repressor